MYKSVKTFKSTELYVLNLNHELNGMLIISQ